MKKTKEGGKKGISFLIVRSLFWKSPRNSLSLRFVRTLASLSIPPPRGGSTHTRAVRNSARHWAITTRFTRLCLRAWFDIRGEPVCIHRFCGNVYKQCFVLNEFNVVVVLEDRGNEFYFLHTKFYVFSIYSLQSSSSSSSLFNILSKNLFHRIYLQLSPSLRNHEYRYRRFSEKIGSRERKMIPAYAVTALRADASKESSAKNLTLIDFLAVVAPNFPWPGQKSRLTGTCN